LRIEERIQAALSDALKEHFNADLAPAEFDLEPPPDASLGDLACACFPLAKLCRRPPQQIASTLAESLASLPGIAGAAAAGPYLNLNIERPAWFAQVIPAALRPAEDPASLLYHLLPEPERACVALEFSCPNTNKPQHLGHVRNNILGQGLAELLKAVGHRVIRLNLINDRGVHICRSMLAWQRWGNGETPESSGLKGDHLVGRYYVLFAEKLKEEQDAWLKARNLGPAAMDEEQQREIQRRFEEQSELQGAVRAMLRAWEEGDPEVRALWERINGWVLPGLEETYRRLGLRFDKVYRESETWVLGLSVVKRGLKEGLLKRNETGAVVCPLGELGLEPKVLLRSDGTSIYMTQDLGNAVTRHEELGFDRMIYVVGNEQEHHFKVLFHILKRLGYEWAEHLQHYSYGMVNLTTGKMKSREGRVVDADELLDELEEACRRIMEESRKRAELDEAEQAAINRSLAQAALKYYVLRVNPRLDMTYDPEESIDLAGNTGPYLQYAHARIQSLVRKSGLDPAAVGEFAKLGQPEEVELLKALALWPEQVRLAAQQLNPARLAGRTYELARAFSRFFNAHSVYDRVEDPGLAAQRVALVAAVGVVLRQGLELMGIDAPERI